MKKLWILLAVFIVGVVVAGGLLVIGGDDDEDTNSSTPTVIIDQSLPAEQPEQPAEITQATISAGIKAKQTEFEAANPAYPNPGEIIRYQINLDGTTTPELHPADAELWSMIETLAPTKQVFEFITVFEVYFDERDTTLASVEALDDKNKTWLYSINYSAVAEFEELVPTIVHEFAHILALQDDQTTTEAESADIATTCPNLYVAEGCLTGGSFLNSFYDMFWQGTEADLGNIDRTEAEADAFYAAKESDFVSAYATTNVVEDFAESFMHFTLKETIATTTIRGQKTDFFNTYNNLKGYRSNVRTALSNWAEDTP